MNQKKRYVIGLDPGVKTGYSVWDRAESRLIVCVTVDFWRAINAVKKYYPADNAVVFVEDASLIKATFHFGKSGASKNYQDQISRNVGRVQRECELLIEGFEREGYEVVRVKPQGKKWDEHTFQIVTKWKGRTSEHARDAARLIVGI